MASSNVPLLQDDDTIQFGDEELANSNKLRHPYVTFFHLFFRLSAIVVYLLCDILIRSFIGSFVTIMLLLSMDFWTVKNITGRLMVGLRWWNYVNESGDSCWVFESKKGNAQLHASEVRTFWLALVLVPLIWSLLFIVAFFRFNFQWLVLVGIALTLSGANLYAYIKCRVGVDQPMSSSISNISSNFFWRQLFPKVTNMMTRSEQPSQHNQSAVI